MISQGMRWFSWSSHCRNYWRNDCTVVFILVGAYGGRPFLQKYGKYLFIHDKHTDLAENWFNKYGAGVVFSARFVPVVRHAISIPAGIAKMPFWKFTSLTVLAMIPWSIFFIYLGGKLGEKLGEQ